MRVYRLTIYNQTMEGYKAFGCMDKSFEGGSVVPLEDVEELQKTVDEILDALETPLGYLIHRLMPAVNNARKLRNKT